MAKKLKDEDLVLNIIVNGDKGRSEMNQLNRAISDTKVQLTALEAERKKLIASGKQDTIEWHANANAIKQANNAINQAEERLKVLRSGMKLTDMSIRDLTREQQRLTALMKSSVPGSENWIRYKNDLKLVQNRLRELSGEAQRAGVSLSKAADKFNRYAGVVTAFAGSVAVGVMGLRKASEAYAEYDDKLADVMKTTGLAKEQVEGMSEALSNVDTRTSQQELLDLGYQAGKLGISAEKDVESFVVAADKMGVALGEDLGGKEEAINTMGKLVDLFKIKDEYGMADGMLKVGSAVNALGAASTANEGYIVDFTSRVGGIAVSSNISAANVMGLAATFDSLNAQSEASSTVVNKIVVGMFKNTSEYAKVAGMDIRSFTTLLKTDTNEALLRVLGGFKGADLGVTASLLGEVGENGARAAQAVALISENINVVREQQAIANEEFAKGIGVVDEFNTKNSTAQAQLEKAQKRAQKNLVELGAMIQPLMNGTITGFSAVVKGLTAAVKYFIEYKAVIIGLTVATLTLVAAQKIQNSWDEITVALGKLKTFWSNANTVSILREAVAISGSTIATATYTTAQKGLIAVKALLVGQFKAAGIAAKAFFASLGPVGWIITGITLLGGALGYLSARADKASASQKALTDINNKATLAVISEKSEIERLLSIASAKEESDKRRIAAMEKLQQLIPNGIELINQETIANGKAKVAVDQYIQSLLLRAKLEAAKDYLVDYEKERLAAIQGGSASTTSFWQKIGAVASSVFGGIQATISTTMEQSISNLNEYEAETKSTSESIAKYITDLEKQLDVSPGGGITDNSNKDDAGGSAGGGGASKEKWSLDSDQQFIQERIKLKMKLFKGEIATEEEHNRQLLALETATLEKRVALGKEVGEDRLKLLQDLADKHYNQRKANEARLQKLQDVADGGKSDFDQERIRYEKQLKDLGLFGIAREQMTELQLEALVSLESQHAKKMSSLNFNSLGKQFDNTKKAMQDDITALKIKQGEELSTVKTFADKKRLLAKYYSLEELRQITTDKEADKAIKAAYQQQEVETQQKHLTNMLSLYKSMIDEYKSKGTIFGTVITSEDAKRLDDIIANLKKQLADLGATIKFTPEKGLDSGADILGMTPDKWSTLFDNLKDGKGGLDDWAKAVGAVGQAVGQTFSEVSSLMTNIEQRELKNFEKSQNKKKQSLDRQLKAGTISQESYNARVQQLDAETEAKQEEATRKQAERQKVMAVFQVLLNTAMAIMSTSAQLGWPAAIPFVAAVSALGAIQIAAILAQPLPGAEQGGMLVEREQDGELFNAVYSPKKRGRVDSPTVIVGENGSEYVVPAEGYDNPTIRPVLDVIEKARLNGTLKQLDLNSFVATSHLGRANGGHVSYDAKGSASVNSAVIDPQTQAVIEEMIVALRLLNEKLPHLKAYVSYTGKGGVLEAKMRYEMIPKDL